MMVFVDGIMKTSDAVSLKTKELDWHRMMKAANSLSDTIQNHCRSVAKHITATIQKDNKRAKRKASNDEKTQLEDAKRSTKLRAATLESEVGSASVAFSIFDVVAGVVSIPLVVDTAVPTSVDHPWAMVASKSVKSFLANASISSSVQGYATKYKKQDGYRSRNVAHKAMEVGFKEPAELYFGTLVENSQAELLNLTKVIPGFMKASFLTGFDPNFQDSGLTPNCSGMFRVMSLGGIRCRVVSMELFAKALAAVGRSSESEKLSTLKKAFHDLRDSEVGCNYGISSGLVLLRRHF